MKKFIKWTLIVVAGVFSLLLIGLGALIIYAKYFDNSQDETVSYYTDELPLNNSDYLEEFEEIHQITLDNYSLYKSKGLNMDSIHDSLIKRMKGKDVDATEFGKILNEYFSALNVGHAFAYLNKYTAAYSPVFIEGRIFVDSPNEYLLENGFKDKDEIIAINGTSINEWLETNEKYTSASTPEAKMLMTALDAMRSWEDTIVSYKILRDADTLEIALPLKKRNLIFDKSNNVNIVESKILHDSIGYINIISMMDPVTEEFKTAYKNLSTLPYLIVDIRNNGGGNSGNGREIAEYLIREPQPHCVSLSTIMQPQDNSYKGTLYLLIDTYTFSAAESFALDIKESGNATLMGLPTGGDTGNSPKTFHTENGIYFRLPTNEPSKSPKGFPMEGVGIDPDFKVHQIVSDFMNGHDTVLDFTIKVIQDNMIQK